MFFNYLNIILEVTAHVFRAFGACVVLFPFTYFAGSIALDMCNGLSVILGLMAVASAIIAVAAVYMELEQAAEKISTFKFWRADVQKM